MRRIVTMPNFNAVAANQTATIDLPVNDIYHGLKITYGTATAGGPNLANMQAEILEIRLKIDGKTQRRMTGSELFAINAYHGIPFSTGIIPIFFSEPWRRTPPGEESLAWGMGDVSTFQIEIDIGAATTPSLSCLAVIQKGARNMGPISKWRRYVIPVSAIGIVNVTTLPKQDAYLALHANSLVCSDIEIKVDQEEVFKATLAQATELYAEQGFAMQTGFFTVDFAYTGQISDSLGLVRADGKGRINDLRIDFNMSAATTFNLLTEQIGFRD